MSWSASPDAPRASIALPHRVLRYVSLPRRLAPGSRVCLVNSDDPRLTAALDAQCCEWTVWHTSPDREPHSADCWHASHEDLRCDLVLLHDLDVYRQDLFSAAALDFTARCLSLLRPGGELLLTSRVTALDPQTPVFHLRTCFARHFACFLGTSRVAWLPDPWWTNDWKALWQASPIAGHLVACLESPEGKAVSPGRWMHLAQFERARAASSCCEWSARSSNRHAA